MLACVLGLGAAAAALECPRGMAPVDGAFCMDVYEYPNMDGAMPFNDVAWEDADHQCRADGKRLCTAAELHKACAGPAGGDAQAGNCAAGGERKRSGAAADCRSGYGIFDLSGNLAEWTADSRENGQRGAHGGSVAHGAPAEMSCGAVSLYEAAQGHADVGFRCCAGPVMEYAALPAPVPAPEPVAELAPEIMDPAPEAMDPAVVPAQPVVPSPPLQARPNKGIPSDTTVEVRRNTTRKRRHWEDKDLPARAVVSPLTRMHPGHAREGLYASVQYQDLGNIYSPQSLNAQVSAWAWAYSVGYKFDNALIVEGTAINHKVEERRGNTWSGDRDIDFVWHASYAIADLFQGELWPGDLVAGARRFDNSVGQATEIYVAKEFVHGPWVITPAVNYISRSTREDDPGVALDVRYYVTPYFNVFGTYNSQDFYKSIVNDYLAPTTSLGPLASCADCNSQSASLGVDYGVFKHQGGFFFQVYDVGDLNAPMGGLYVNF